LILLAMRPALPNRAERAQGFGLAVSSGIGMLFQMDGLSYTSASTSAFLTQGYVVILPIVAAIGSRAWPSARIALCVLTICVGLGVLSRFDLATLGLGRGETETLLAACCFAVQILILDSPRFRENRASVVSVVMFVCLAGVLAPIAFVNARTLADFRLLVASSQSVWLLLALSIPCTAIAFALMNRYQPALTASEAGIVYGAEPVFTSLYALFLPSVLGRFAQVPYVNEAPTQPLLVGGTLVVAANVILQLPSREKLGPRAA
ncbi:MAG TPA: EamA family transporter, partial [Polyangiaceae bacterium]